MSDDLDINEIRHRADKRAKKRAGFIQHLAIYVIINLCLWVMFLFIGGLVRSPWPLVLPLLSTFGWGIGVAIHGVVTYLETGVMENMQEREFERELRREMLRRGITDPAVMEKPKREERDRVVRLSEDGELIYEEDEIRTSKRKH
jgi:hypothetical protein